MRRAFFSLIYLAIASTERSSSVSGGVSLSTSADCSFPMATSWVRVNEGWTTKDSQTGSIQGSEVGQSYNVKFLQLESVARALRSYSALPTCISWKPQLLCWIDFWCKLGGESTASCSYTTQSR